VTEWTSDAEVAAALIDLGAHVAVPEHSLWPRIRASVDEGVERRPMWPMWVVMATVIAVIAITAVSIAPARRAVADLLGIGATHVQHVDRLPDDEGARPLPARSDRAALQVQLVEHRLYEPDLRLAGEPIAWTFDPDGETVVAYQNVVLSQRSLAGAAPATKRYAGSRTVEYVKVGGHTGIFVGGDHTRTVEGSTYRSTSAVIWDDGDVELRIEGDPPRAQLTAVAESVRRAQ
jgi:hypothetical protein